MTVDHSELRSPVTKSLKRISASGRSDYAPALILEAGGAERNYWRSLFRYKDLFVILAWRDITVQYKQAYFGVAWALLRPLMSMAIFTFVFGHVAHLPSEGGAPYPILVLAGMLPWFLMSTILSQSANSLVLNQSLVSKVYFPRLIIPVSSSLVALVDFVITFILTLAVMIAFAYPPTLKILLVPLFIALSVVAALGPGLLLCSLNVRYRDFRILVPFIVQFGLYISPVGFSSTIVPDRWRLIYSLNPAVGVIDGFRWCLLQNSPPLYWPGVSLSVTSSVALLLIGARYFRATEKSFADVI